MDGPRTDGSFGHPPSRLVVPRHNVQTLCTVESGRLRELYAAPIPIDAECVTNRHGWVAWRDPDELNPIHIWHCASNPNRNDFAPLRVPGVRYIEHLAFQENVLWIVSERMGFLTACPLDSPARVPVEIAIPVAEPITHLAFHGSKLYATSDDGEHKRLWRLSVTQPWQVVVNASIELPRRNQDCFLDLAVGDSWVAVLEWTFSFCEESCHLRLFDPESLAILARSERTSVTTNSLFLYPDAGCRIEGAADWKSLAWMGDVLLLASGSRGVGALDLCGLHPEAPLEREIQYLRTPGEARRAIPSSSLGTALAVFATAEGLDTIVVETPW